jgi:cytochrome P450
MDKCQVNHAASCELARIKPPVQALSGLRLFRTIVRNPIEAWPAEIYREGIFRRRVLGRDIVYVCDPDLIEHVLVHQASAFAKGELARRALGPALGDSILIAEGERWRWQRRCAAPLFRPEPIAAFVPTMRAAAEQTARRWLSRSADSEINVAHEMMRTTFDIIVATMLPGRASMDVDSVEEAITAYLDSVSWVIALTMLRAPRWMPYPGWRRTRRAQHYLRRAFADLVALGRPEDGQRNDLLALLQHATDPETGAAMDAQSVADNLITFIAAGHETTALALTWTLYLLSLHPAAEEQVRREIETVAGSAPIGPEHIAHLSFTRQVLQEAMRLYPPVAVLARTALDEIHLGPERIAGGATVYVPIYALHRHHKIWDSPDVFDPDRFQPDLVKARPRYAYLPFGAGPRICIGMTFAMTEAIVILATLLRRVRLELRPGYVPAPKLRVTLRPAVGMPMTAHPRKAEQSAAGEVAEPGAR